jgi:hypothetical protein
MARENRRARDEKRFGKPERLADRLDLGRNQWVSPPWLLGCSREQFAAWETYVRMFSIVEKCPVVTIDNVSQYVFDNFNEKFGCVHADAFPCLRLPFPVMWIESARPARFLDFDSNSREFPGGFPRRWGWLCCQAAVSDTRYADTAPAGAGLVLTADLVKLHVDDDRPHGPYSQVRVFTDLRGTPIDEVQGCAFFSDRADKVEDYGCFIDWQVLGVPAFLAICFMACKNVVVDTIDPDVRLNRERRKNGMKPFLRYHVINIEPMKKVLRTEGRSESEGLRRALHICRGHFSTYSEEKPLFGKVAGTFWIPSHVRGSIKEGVVVSDYRVAGPK